jgi:hypothetical protein
MPTADDYVKLTILVLSIAAAIPPLAQAVLEARIPHRPSHQRDRSESLLRVVGFTTTDFRYPAATEISHSRRRYFWSGVAGIIFVLLALIILLVDPTIRLVDQDDPNNAIALSKWLFVLPLLNGCLLAWWGFRLWSQIWNQKEKEPAFSHDAALCVDGDSKSVLVRCQAAFIAVGALRSEGTEVQIDESKDVGLEGALFAGQRRPYEKIALEVKRIDECRYSVVISSATFKARFRTARFKDDVQWIAESILS